VLDPHVFYKALQTRDERFDGRVFVGVVSTGIYCRPICPARPARVENCRFFPSAAAAQEAGFRPCLRCRPETAPELGSWRGTSNTVSRGLALIAEGVLDRDAAGVDELADRLGVGARQVRRLFQRHLGASPLAVAQTRRVLFAKQLIVETNLPMAEVAFVAGFRSVRRFNETFRALFQRPPSALRRAPALSIARPLPLPLSPRSSGETGVTVRLSYRPPYDWPAILSYLAARAIEGIERVDRGRYCRTLFHDGQIGTVEVTHDADAKSLAATIRFPSIRALPSVIGRIRRVFDLGADVRLIGGHLARDPLLARLVVLRPGLRVPGGWDGFEVAVRAVLGQRRSVEAARELAGQLARLCGTRIDSQAGHTALTRVFPTAAQVARADLSKLGIPANRRRTLTVLAQAADADRRLFQPRGTVEETVSKLRALFGVGDWTAHTIALRALGEPDAFPASDRGLLRGAGRCGAAMTPAELVERAQPWRPWRGYAAQHLWAADAESSSTQIEASL
jgi:AraC family transcriptional regulator, regulatory protein of adaptative response / DNA-3-methyladenine glycosylase II